ncbi:MAG: hypothetical protein A3F67_11770 [Verrucomicrobia bacterium RIFCSPHIGHO2_12_FULL_41_10]|nr:MAG: hypothetical protein A3F67_11770 [Verrucomicrobia bacterium RIFCSPHIGHO2_12_FULL_41_10]
MTTQFNNWLSSDNQSPSIDWSSFDYERPYEDIQGFPNKAGFLKERWGAGLSNKYSTRPLPNRGSSNLYLAGLSPSQRSSLQQEVKDKHSRFGGAGIPQGRFSFSDPSKQRYVDAILKQNPRTRNRRAFSDLNPFSSNAIGSTGSRYTDALQKLTGGNRGGFLNPNDSRFSRPTYTEAYDNSVNSKKIREQINKVATQYGVSPEEVTNAWKQYYTAKETMADPIGRNWQDVKSSPFYSDLKTGIKGSIASKGMEDEFYTDLNEFYPDANFAAEYFPAHAAPFNPGMGPNVNHYTPNITTDYRDFLSGPENLSSVEEIAQAKQLAASHLNYQTQLASNGGPFDLIKETGMDKIGTPEGTHWIGNNGKDGAYGKLNTAQNFMNTASDGTKSFVDTPWNDIKAALLSKIEKDRVKNPMGGVVGSLLSQGMNWVIPGSGFLMNLMGVPGTIGSLSGALGSGSPEDYDASGAHAPNINYNTNSATIPNVVNPGSGDNVPPSSGGTVGGTPIADPKKPGSFDWSGNTYKVGWENNNYNLYDSRGTNTWNSATGEGTTPLNTAFQTYLGTL